MVFNPSMMRRAAGLLLGLIAVFATPATAGAAVDLAPIGSFNQPVFVTSDPSDPDRLFVVERQGRIVLLDRGQKTFVDLGDLVESGGQEQGLLSVALAPDYSRSGRLYVFYTRRGDGILRGALQIDELTASGDRAPLASRRPVLTVFHPIEGNHNGGQLQFGPDGYLYISTGDGGSQGDPPKNAQSTSSLLGKILRIDPRPGGGYTVPSDNPFVGGAGADEIWSLGLRNPWRFSFDRVTGDLLIGDVGGGVQEEIDFSPAPVAGRGLNFGWDCREGTAFHEDCPPGLALTGPIHTYAHAAPGMSAVVGGYVVRDDGLEELYGRYVYADTYAGQLRSLVPGLPAAGDRSEGRQVPVASSFGEDACGRVYTVSLAGAVSRLGDGSPAPCVVGGGGGGGAAGQEFCAGRPATIIASARRLEGTKRADVIVGVPGRNLIRGRGGADVICGLGGKDRLSGGGGKDRLRGGHGADRCSGGPGRDRLRSC
jgi:glucose/arabinose dehydrogenase